MSSTPNQPTAPGLVPDSYFPVLPQGVPRLHVRVPVTGPTSSVVDVAGAALRRVNPFHAAGTLLGREFADVALPAPPEDPDFDALASIRDTPYASIAHRFADPTLTPLEAERIKQDFDQAQADQRILADSGALGAAAMLVAGVVDPVNLFPLAGGRLLAAGARVRRGVLQGAAAALAEETLLRAHDPTRTAEDSRFNVALSALFGGIASGLAGPRLAKQVAAHIAETDAIEAGARSAGAAEATATRSAAQAMDDEALVAAFGLERLPDNPVKRLLRSQSLRAREIVSQLVELGGLVQRKNLAGVASLTSVETRARTHLYPLYEALGTVDDLYTAYRGQAAMVGKSDLSRAVRMGIGDIRDLVRGTNGKLTRAQFFDEVGKALRRNDAHAIPEVAEAAKVFRRHVFDRLKKEAEDVDAFTAPLRARVKKLEAEAERAGGAKLRALQEEINGLKTQVQQIRSTGVGITTAASYFPRVFRRDRILEDLPRFTAIVRGHLAGKGVKGTELDRAVNETIDAILRSTPYHRLDEDTTGAARSLKARAFDIPDELVEDFLENNAEAVARQFTRTFGTDVELVRAFDAIDLTDAIDEIRSELRAAGLDPVAIEKQLADVRALRDRLRGTYGLPDDPNRTLSHYVRIAKQFNFVTMLGGVVVSALPDLLRPVMVEGMDRSLRHALRPLIRGVNRQALRMATGEVQKAGAALDIVMGTRALAFADVGDTFGRHSRLQRGLDAGAGVFATFVTLLNPWNQMAKEWAGLVVSGRILEAAEAWRAGAIAQGDVTKMARAGIDRPMAERIARQAEAHGTVEDGLRLPNTDLWDDAEAVAAFRAALASDVDRIIVTPGAGDRPLWASTEFGSLVAQFKSFGLASVQRVLVSGLQERDANFFLGAAMLIGAGVVVDSLKRAQFDVEEDDGLAGRLIAGIDRSGVLGYFMDANNIVEKLSDNTLGFRPLADSAPRFDTTFKSKLGAIAGPTAQQLANAVMILSDVGSFNYSHHTAHRLRQLMPLQNVPYLQGVFDQVEKAL